MIEADKIYAITPMPVKGLVRVSSHLTPNGKVQCEGTLGGELLARVTKVDNRGNPIKGFCMTCYQEVLFFIISSQFDNS